MRRLFSIIPVTVTMTVAVTIITVLGLLFTGGPLCGLFVATPHFGLGWFLSMFAHSSWGHWLKAFRGVSSTLSFESER